MYCVYICIIIMAKDIELLQEIFIGGTRKYICQTSSSVGCRLFNSFMSIWTRSVLKKKDVRGVRNTRYICIVLYIALSLLTFFIFSTCYIDRHLLMHSNTYWCWALTLAKLLFDKLLGCFCLIKYAYKTAFVFLVINSNKMKYKTCQWAETMNTSK